MIRYAHTLDSPIGPLVVVVGPDGALTEIEFGRTHHNRLFERMERAQIGLEQDPRRTDPVARQLDEYFAGVRRAFDLALAPEGTPFQLRVWEELRRIPYGVTTTYGKIAERIGKPTASRAVGLANGSNPIPIVVPCHRVIGSSGALTGFGGGIDVKAALLALESGQLAWLDLVAPAAKSEGIADLRSDQGMT
ncbi:MAG TPA: methylated-DNA--[protein]-cysteine S-methyltransferase [Candidatus Dormibacteraeota bacterium]|nr:methylated-DNA--[protein]-cysteine S-methyltransferase [Candidatus Dormibacteraeota bacterium]